MAIEVRIPTILRKHTGGEKVVHGDGSNLKDLFDHLNDSYPGLREAVLSESGDLHRFINCYLNDEDVRFIGSLETPVKDGDIVSILPAVAGG